MSMRIRSFFSLAFILFLLVYARSEGDRLPTFLFYSFGSLWVFALAGFLWWRYRSTLTWSIPEDSQEAFSLLPVTVSGRFPPLSLGQIQASLSLPWKLATGNTLEFTVLATPGQWTKDLLIPLGQRGRYEIGPLTAMLEDPFGLFRARVRLGLSKEIFVTPRLLPIDQLRSPHGVEPWSGQLALTGQASSSARKYQTGDPWQHIHWKATARLQTLMVRETETFADTDPLLWLDLSASAYAGNPEALETAVSLAASLLTEFARQGIPLTFLAASRKTWTFSLPDGDLQTALRYLATARADGPDPVIDPTILPLTRELILISSQLTSALTQYLERHYFHNRRALILLTGLEPSSPTTYPGMEVRYYHHA